MGNEDGGEFIAECGDKMMDQGGSPPFMRLHGWGYLLPI